MRKLIVTIMLSFLVGGFYPGTHAWSEPMGYLPPYWPGGEMYPKAVLEEANHDFGEVRPGITVKYDFKVKNQGEALLLIRKVIPGCGCSLVKFDRAIQPGETGTIVFSVKIYPEWAGQRFTKGALAITNDPAMPRFTLKLTGQVGQPEARKPVRKPKAGASTQ